MSSLDELGKNALFGVLNWHSSRVLVRERCKLAQPIVRRVEHTGRIRAAVLRRERVCEPRTRRAVERGRLGERHVHLVDAESSPSRRTSVAPRRDVCIRRNARLERGDLLTQRDRLLETLVHCRVGLGCARRVQTAGLEPNVLQRRAWALCLAGKDVLIVAPTGSGKTLAAVAPLPSLLAGSSISVVFQLTGSVCGSTVILIVPGVLWAMRGPVPRLWPSVRRDL